MARLVARPARRIAADDDTAASALRAGVPLPTLADFPIPANVAAGGAGWSPSMIEMADHIGARATLLISDRFGGEEMRIPIDPRRNPFRALIGDELATRVSAVYGGERLAIPIARYALDVARRAGVIATVRAGRMTRSDMARVLRIRRDSASHLINRTDEGVGIEAGELPMPRALRLVLDVIEIAADAMAEAGVPAASIARMRAAIMGRKL